MKPLKIVENHRNMCILPLQNASKSFIFEQICVLLPFQNTSKSLFFEQICVLTEAVRDVKKGMRRDWQLLRCAFFYLVSNDKFKFWGWGTRQRQGRGNTLFSLHFPRFFCFLPKSKMNNVLRLMYELKHTVGVSACKITNCTVLGTTSAKTLFHLV